ncbi:hypothetical protein RIVM261_059000 [Rivularia sp. IAM M-261]|nr:hypothetical protein CAL7716_034020 [Calothrix sp. PCC 7716]GJD20944.1 hypothetical protein RIVM261_059000 [Rivularia sp. IAM M-261]
MYGMATTSTLGSNDSNNRLVLVEVTGAVHKQVHNSNYIIKVPFNRLSQTIQRITRTGGKVVNVTMSSLDIKEQNTQVEAIIDEKITAKPILEKTRSFGNKSAEKAPKNTKRAKKTRS